MEFANKLIKGTIVGLYKDYILDVRLGDDSVVPVFCTGDEYNTAIFAPGNEVFISRSNDSRRRLRYDLQIVCLGAGLVFVNPAYNRRLFIEALENNTIEDFKNYTGFREIEEADNLPHLDLELSNERGEKCYVFITNVCNKAGTSAVFPCQINFFELKMFDTMQALRAQGAQTVVVMIVPRMDCIEAKFTWNMDPIAAAKIFDEAKNGLDFVCYSCNIDKKSVTISKKMDIIYK